MGQVVLPLIKLTVCYVICVAYMFFTDSGAFGETSLENKTGSVFAYRFEDKTLRALIFRQLAYPCGVILNP